MVNQTVSILRKLKMSIQESNTNKVFFSEWGGGFHVLQQKLGWFCSIQSATPNVLTKNNTNDVPNSTDTCQLSQGTKRLYFD